MSSAGQIAGGIVGGVIGFFAGYPFLGAQLGMLLGGSINPPKGPTTYGPTLSDLTVQTSTYGAAIPRGYGAFSVVGNIFWLENNQLKATVTKKKSGGGKGGGKKTTTVTTTYSATFAVGLCKGPIVGVRRIWIGPTLIYDATSSDPSTIAASNSAASGFVVYTGTDTQQPDTRMQATLGVANTPAWRGLAYIVFYDLQLANYGNSLAGAQVKVEVLTLGATYSYTYNAVTTPGGYNFGRSAWNGSVFCAISGTSSGVCWTSPDGVTWTPRTMPETNSWADIASNGSLFVVLVLDWHVNYCYTSPDGINWTKRYFQFPSVTAGYHTRIIWNGAKFLVGTDDAGYVPFETSPDGITWSSQTSPYSGGTSCLAWNGSKFLAVHNSQFWTSPSGNAGTWTLAYTDPGGGINWNSATAKGNLFCVASDDGGRPTCTSPDGVTWTKTTQSFPTNLNGLATDGRVFLAGSNDRYYTSPDGVTWSYTAVTPSGQYSYPCFNGAQFLLLVPTTTKGILVTPSFISAIQPTLSQVVSGECLLSGNLNSGDIDTTLLSSNVTGYRIGQQGSIRNSLEPLQTAFPFDVVQRGYKIKFIPRGNSAVMTIAAADLDAHSSKDKPGVQITTKREVDSQLPRRVIVKFLDMDREYDVGSQYAERLNTSAINEKTVDLPIVFNSTDAAGKAQIILYSAWLERTDIQFNLPSTYNALEPADVVNLPTPEGVIAVRLVGISYTSDHRLECKAKVNVAAVYTPNAVGVAGAVTGQTTLVPVGASTYLLLDLPRMSDSQADPCLLLAMTGVKAGWKGGSLFQSTDSGSTWADIYDVGAPGSTMGIATNSIGAVEQRMKDSGSSLSVKLTQGSLSSITELAMLAGGNHFAYGVNGRWEIIAAQTCTLVSGTTYTLTNLLRGRYGTEQYMGSHVNGDSVVLLDSTTLSLLSMSSSVIGLSRLYRGITFDRDISTDSNLSFSYNAINLKPLSPVYLTGDRDNGFDWNLSWLRRTRANAEWMDSVDAPLGETSEAYQIDVFSDGTYTSVKRTISTTSPNTIYSSSNQIADFGSNQSTLYLKIYQMSEVVGRGYPLTQSITR